MPPSAMGSFEIKFELYHDGGKTVYVASHPQYGDVAVKLLPRGFWDDLSFRLRFEREVSLVASLNHFAIVPVYELGEHDGQPYLAMRFIPGRNLAERLGRGPLPFKEAVYIIGQLAQALDAAHEKGVLHRNLKPQNVLFDEQGEPYLTDFSLVKREQSSLIVPVTAYASLTAIDGAPATMSPEQARGQPLDGRSDIYALGALLYQMLTGRQPFGGVSPIDQAVQAVTAPIPSACKLRPGLPPGCDEVIAKTLAKDAQDRYQTAYDLAADMALLAENHRVLPVSQKSAAPSGCTRIIAAAAALILIAAIGVGLGLITHVLNFDRARETVSLLLVPRSAASPTSTGGETALSERSSLPGPAALTQGRETAQALRRPPPSNGEALPASSTPSEQVFPSVTPNAAGLVEGENTPTRQANEVRPPTVTAVEVELPTPTLTPALVVAQTPALIGGADLLAFLNANDIWIANLDGSGLDRLTQDKTVKNDLQWTPDGLALTYYSEGCYYLLPMDTRTARKIGCFSDFELSPDMSMVVIGDKVRLDNGNMHWVNFLTGYDLNSLGQLKEVPQKPTFGGCPFFGGRHTRFSTDGELLAAVFESPQGGRNVDMIQVFSANVCNTMLDPLDGFPGLRFEMKGFSGPADTPALTDFGWDGEFLFALHGNILNGYGEMVIYNMSLGRADVYTPIDGQCCYQDIQWSPDSQYLLFVYQDARLGSGAQIYLVPFGALGTGETYTPIEMPFYFFADPKARLEPALRPVQP